MSEVDDNRTLNEIILPGSHDAGMGTIYSCGWPATEANARTQTLSIGEQLNAGARYFDLRVMYFQDYRTPGDYFAYHGRLGFNCKGFTFHDIFAEIFGFLYDHPTETAVIRVNKTDGASIRKILDMLDTTYDDYVYRKSGVRNPVDIKLKNLRGKMLFLFDEGELDDESLQRYYSLRKASGSIDESMMNIDGGTKYGNSMQDQLSALSDNFGGLGQRRLYYISFHAGGMSNKLYEAKTNFNPFLGEMASKIKQEVKLLPNIIHIDDVNSDATRPIIDLNFINPKSNKVYFFFSDGTYNRTNVTNTSYEIGHSEDTNQYFDDISTYWNGIGRNLTKYISAVGTFGNPVYEYFFLSGGTYIRYNMVKDQVDLGPAEVSKFFKGISDESAKKISSILDWNNNITYIFLDDHTYIRYDKKLDKAIDETPRDISQYWGQEIGSKVLKSTLNFNNKIAYFYFDDNTCASYDMQEDKFIAANLSLEKCGLPTNNTSGSEHMVGAISVNP
jgi:hypothetical protein